MNMNLSEELLNGNKKISVIGLGYVGMPLAVAFAKKVPVIGFDINEEKVNLYKNGVDPTNEVGNDAIKTTTVEFTSDEQKLKESSFHIVSVPTPIKVDKSPNLAPIEGASETIGRNLTKGSIVVYESTVYPGVTEDVCIPILERESGLKCGIDFKVGYSPERINPGDKVNTVENIVKIVSGIDQESLDQIASVYEIIIKAGVHRASTIKVAEAAKVVENSQRDINIAFMNELAKVFDTMDIDTKEVIDAMKTKWNALPFYPGLVGGHCIGVDPYYFIYQAEQLGYHSQIILSGRKINDSMGEFVADAIIKKLIETDKVVKQAKVVILGITFKEDTPDIRNSKVFDIVKKLNEYGVTPVFSDPLVDKKEAKEVYGVNVLELEEIKDMDCVIIAVPHREIKSLSLEAIDSLYNQKLDNSSRIIIDVKSTLDKKVVENLGFNYWRL